jgi:hypothetical protein
LSIGTIRGELGRPPFSQLLVTLAGGGSSD